MCGIVAVAGHSQAASILLEGLKRLEYRGYDSAGVALMSSDGSSRRVRAAGKVSALLEAMPAEIDGATGVAHTRWATHGIPSKANAHPHRAGRVSLVHNGIIENYKSLRLELQENGKSFSSLTDTEVVAHLFALNCEKMSDPIAAWLETLSRLDGAFALAAMVDGYPDMIFGARRGAPLIAAQGNGSGFLASDVMAITGEAEAVVYLEEGDAAVE